MKIFIFKLLCLLALSLSSIGCNSNNKMSQDEIDFSEVTKKGNVDSYFSYLQKYPRGKYYDEAVKRFIMVMSSEKNNNIEVKQFYYDSKTLLFPIRDDSNQLKDLSLPITFDIAKLCKYSDIKNASIIVSLEGIPIKVKGLKGGLISGAIKDKIFYIGASIVGSLTLKDMEKKDIKKKEYSFVLTPEVYIPPPLPSSWPTKPSMAPFGEIYKQKLMPLIIKMMAEIWGYKKFCPALADKDLSPAVAENIELNIDYDDRLELLIFCLMDNNSVIREEARKLSLKIKDPRKIDRLIEGIKDNNIKLRSIRALKEITGKDYGNDYGKWIEWRNALKKNN